MRRSFALLITAAVTSGLMTAAGALAPIAVLTYEDHGRAQATEAAALTASPGSELVIASYTLAPGTNNGWQEHGGPAALAVSRGALVLHSASGCTSRKYIAGEAAVLPAGRHLLSNPGDQPLAFSGAFLDAAPDGITPFLDGADAPPPADCVGVVDDGLHTAPARASMVRSGRGTFVGPNTYGHSAHRHHAGGVEVEVGKDIYVVSLRAEPYGTGGWMTHQPMLSIVTKGTLTYYEGHNGRCVKAGEFNAGQAYVHASPVTHMPVNEGPEAVEMIAVFFNLPHNSDPLPLAGGLTDAIDFTALPPQDCPRLTYVPPSEADRPHAG
jgi:quercetin dioxygenase-like cupin family protein